MPKWSTRRVSLVAVLASLSFFVAACGGAASKNGVASLGQGATTTTVSSSAPAGQGAGGGGESAPAGDRGGGPGVAGISATLSIGGSYTQDLKFAECLRSHGLPSFPDPGPNGTFHITSSSGAVPGSPQFQAAQKACQKFTPGGGSPPSPAAQAKRLAEALQYSDCMRSHGIKDFPDPESSNGRVGFSITAGPSSDLNPNNPQFDSAQTACEHYLSGPPA